MTDEQADTPPIDIIDLVFDTELAPYTKPRKRDHFSFSQLTMWLRCGMQYWFRYVAKRIERPALALSNGRAGHTALEFNNQHKIRTLEDAPLEAILDIFSDSYDAATIDLTPSDLKDGQSIGASKDATAKVLEVYRRKHAPRITPLAVEQPFRLVIPPDQEHDEPILPIEGFIDSIQRETEDHPLALPKVAIIDDKFRAKAGHPEEANYSNQLTLYDMVSFKMKMPVDQLGIQTFIPANTRQPPRVIPILRDAEWMKPEFRLMRHQRLIQTLRTVSKAIREGIFPPVDDPKVCGWCGYRDICQYSLVRTDDLAHKIQDEVPQP